MVQMDKWRFLMGADKSKGILLTVTCPNCMSGNRFHLQSMVDDRVLECDDCGFIFGEDRKQLADDATFCLCCGGREFFQDRFCSLVRLRPVIECYTCGARYVGCVFEKVDRRLMRSKYERLRRTGIP